MFITLFGTIVIAGIIGVLSENLGFTRNGLIPSVIIAIGGAFLFYFIGVMFNLSFGSRGLDAIVAASGALVLIPTHYRLK